MVSLADVYKYILLFAGKLSGIGAECILLSWKDSLRQCGKHLPQTLAHSRHLIIPSSIPPLFTCYSYLLPQGKLPEPAFHFPLHILNGRGESL